MNRERVWKPSKKYEEAYGFDDFFEGNSLMFHGHEFILQHCDEYTRKLVEGIERRALHETIPISETQNGPLKDFAKKLLAANARTFFQFAKILDKERKGAISLEDMFSTLQSLSVQCTKAVSASFSIQIFVFLFTRISGTRIHCICLRCHWRRNDPVYRHNEGDGVGEAYRRIWRGDRCQPLNSPLLLSTPRMIIFIKTLT